jgi:hypothetical protein
MNRLRIYDEANIEMDDALAISTTRDRRVAAEFRIAINEALLAILANSAVAAQIRRTWLSSVCSDSFPLQYHLFLSRRHDTRCCLYAPQAQTGILEKSTSQAVVSNTTH